MNLISILALVVVPVVLIAIGLVVGRVVGSSSMAADHQPALPHSDLHVVPGGDVEQVA